MFSVNYELKPYTPVYCIRVSFTHTDPLCVCVKNNCCTFLSEENTYNDNGFGLKFRNTKFYNVFIFITLIVRHKYFLRQHGKSMKKERRQ